MLWRSLWNSRWKFAWFRFWETEHEDQLWPRWRQAVSKMNQRCIILKRQKPTYTYHKHGYFTYKSIFNIQVVCHFSYKNIFKIFKNTEESILGQLAILQVSEFSAWLVWIFSVSVKLFAETLFTPFIWECKFETPVVHVYYPYLYVGITVSKSTKLTPVGTVALRYSGRTINCFHIWRVLTSCL